MIKFNSIFKNEIIDFLNIRRTILGNSAYKHNVCYLASFDAFLINIDQQERKITETILNGWLKTLVGKKRSKVGKVIIIRIFIKYLRSLGVSAHDPIIPKSADDYIPYIFSDEELERIFNAADNIIVTKRQPNPYIKIVFPMILRLLYGCGLRIGETLALRMENIDLEGGILTLLHTKNGKHRLVPMSLSLTEIMRKYCLAMGIIGFPDAFLFPSKNPARPMSIRSVRNRFDTVLSNIGIKLSYRNKCKLPNRIRHERGPCQHCLRHVFVFKSFAQAQKNGRNIDDSIPFLSIYLGHDSLKETEKYLKFSSELFPKALELFENYAGMAFPEAHYEE